MKAISIFYGGRLTGEKVSEKVSDTFFPFFPLLPGTRKTVFLGIEGREYPGLPPDFECILRSSWTRKSLLEELSTLSVDYDFLYFAWADCPFLDPALAGAMAERHMRYGAEYTYADGWPYGFAPEILAHETAGILAKIADDGPVERDTLFHVIQKDINAFDIETEISPFDLRQYRLSLTTDTKRNTLLVNRWREHARSIDPNGRVSSSDAEMFISGNPQMLRTLPAFFPIQVTGACPQACTLCPWPIYGGGETPVTARKDHMPKAVFASLLDKIADFAGDAVIDISLWGEISLHPEKMELIEMVLSRPALSLIVETSGIAWKTEELEALARSAAAAAPRRNYMAPLSWIVSLDAHDPGRYQEIRGPGFPEALGCAKSLLELFPPDAYVQAVRVKGAEDDIELFYKSWKNPNQIIIQKYDDFAGALPRQQAADLSPVKRRPCWHIQRDMVILLDGTVPCCREDLGAIKGKGARAVMGNAFTEDLSLIWERGAGVYKEHCDLEYRDICADCDEWYTFNF